ncbi:MAG: prolipoprotein diacylglyceryl transferase [Candidatus Eisenbacteria bacterium]|uniref:Prolipoprotein diacylglyceryl transferase n=1 Tax=Eiseniibacteriota bacterium TaxID=2212470 RepID=A0A538UAI8_UNCEI|nr:MAG: prolipoprotein diacylglyceryl transferase [Candidatus Eisenbacteria bacterium]
MACSSDCSRTSRSAARSTDGVYPEIFHWGVLHIRSYGLLLAIAFLVGTWLSLREARRRSLDQDHLVTVILVILVSSVLGARAL